MEGFPMSCRKLASHRCDGSLLLVLCFLGLHFHERVQCALNIEPQNAVALSGEVVFISCASDSEDGLTWVAYSPGSSDREYIFSRGVLTDSVKSYISFSVPKRGHCRLKINATRAAAKRYICIDIRTENTASAELIVLERTPECISMLTDSSVNMTCSVKFFGNWAPIMEWKTQKGQNLEANIYYPDAYVVSSNLFLPLHTTKIDTAFRINVVTRFSESGRPEQTTATNVPEYNHTISPFNTGQGFFSEDSRTRRPDIASNTNDTSCGTGSVEDCGTTQDALSIPLAIGGSILILLITATLIVLYFVRKRRLKDRSQSRDTDETPKPGREQKAADSHYCDLINQPSAIEESRIYCELRSFEEQTSEDH